MLLLAACAGGTEPTTTASITSSTVPATTTSATTTVPAIATTTVPVTTATIPDRFEAQVGVVDETMLAHSWHQGCPVAPVDLRLITMRYHAFDGATREGSMVVHRSHAESVIEIFRRLYEGGYPIRSMIPIGLLPEGAEDLTGYANTSGFHCRFVEGTTTWSQHAFGRAVDLNPHLNPLVDGDYIWPIGAERYADRTLGEPGMITPGDQVVEAFASVGWGWGGNFNSFKDWHHFSATGT